MYEIEIDMFTSLLIDMMTKNVNLIIKGNDVWEWNLSIEYVIWFGWFIAYIDQILVMSMLFFYLNH